MAGLTGRQSKRDMTQSGARAKRPQEGGDSSGGAEAVEYYAGDVADGGGV